MRNKRKLKNKVKFFLIGICLIAIVLFIILLNGNNKELRGNKLTNGLFLYQFNEDGIVDINVRDNKIYYLVEKNNEYRFFVMDIYNNKSKEIGTIKSDVCLLKDNYLSCIKGDETTIYDLKLDEIYKSKKSFNIIPYKDSFLIVEDKDIYLDNKKIRTIKNDIERFDIIDYFVAKDNTFIHFISFDDAFIYNVKDDTYEKFNYDDMYLYENGIYYSSNSKIFVKDLNNNSTKEYNNFKKDKDLSFTAVKDNILYYIDNGYLKIRNLDTNKFKYIDYKYTDSIDKMILHDNYLYIVIQGDKPKIYVVKNDEINALEYTDNEYHEILNNKISKHVSELENKYPIDIIYEKKEIDSFSNWKEKLTFEDRYEIVEDTIEGIENIFNKFGKDFISLFKHDNINGLRILIVKKVEPSSSSNVQDISGLTFGTVSNYTVIVSKGDMPYEKIFCHEMMHAIDYLSLDYKYDVAGEWLSYNPTSFAYNIKHYKDNNLENTIYSYNNDDAYFVDSYSKINQDEDRARIFENICYSGSDINFKEYPNLLKKAKYLKDTLVKYYPSLNNSKVFDGME